MRTILLTAALLAAACAVEEVAIKIVKTKPTPKPVSHSTTPADPVASRAAAAFTGPELFRPLLGRCWTTTSGVYEYKLCPFHNVTQKTVGRTYQQFHGILGCGVLSMGVGDLCG